MDQQSDSNPLDPMASKEVIQMPFCGARTLYSTHGGGFRKNLRPVSATGKWKQDHLHREFVTEVT
jgi:hypothetical protein